MPRIDIRWRVAIATAVAVAVAGVALVGCGSSEYAVRPIPQIAAEHVGKPVSQLQDAFGTPRKVETTSTKQVYDWFLVETPVGAPVGLHGCELEVTVDIRSEHVLGYSLADIGWGECRTLQRRIRMADR